MISQLIELSKIGIKYEPRGPMKAQCLANFLVKLATMTEKEFKWWTLYVDGSCNEQGSGADLIMESPNEVIVEQFLRFEFETKNNQAEYKALLAKLQLA